MKTALAALIVGYGLDLLLGDPSFLYHPIRVIGNFIALLEKWLRKVFPKTPKGELTGGVFLVILVCLAGYGVPALLLFAAFKIHPVIGFLLEVLWCWQIPATKCLKDESMKVYQKLKENDLPGARYAVSMIVGRDTENLSETGVTKAAVETIAENTSDGVIAPLLFLAIGGPALGFLYKSINTMDSMVGYKNDKYLYFGRCAAKLDDIVNYIPARISAWLMILASACERMNWKNAEKIYKRDRYCHASPNSAQTEAVMAGALEVQLAGDAVYFGKVVKKPTIGDDIRPVEAEDIKRANHLMYLTSFLGLVFFAGIRALFLFLQKEKIETQRKRERKAYGMRQNPHGGDIYTKKCRVDFSVNVNPLGAPESVKEAVRKSAESVEQYPDALCRDLTRALSEKEQLPEENILFANGAAELIFALTQALRPKKALIAAPGFAEYEAALSAAGCFIRMYPLQKEKGFLLQDDFCDDLTDDLDLVFLCNPNNPTGLTIPQELLLKILDNCRERNIYLVLDECFIEFLPEPEKVTMQGKLDEYPNLLILRAFTKIYAMPGLRLGYLLCSDEDLLDRISRSMQSWNVSIPAQMAGLAALNEDAYVKEARELIRKERAWMKAELEKAGLTVWDSCANYLFFEGPKGLAARLEKGGILIRDCSNYPGLADGYYRAAVRTHEENQILTEAVSQILQWF